MEGIFIADANRFLKKKEDPETCLGVRRAMENDGLFIMRDPRIPADLPRRYREMMVRFFSLPEEVKRKYIQDPLPDGKQIYENGWRPPYTEKPRKRVEVLPKIPKGAEPHEPPETDPKERFMWPYGNRFSESVYPMLDNLESFTPEEIPEWAEVSTAWAKVMYDAMMTAMEMLAIGFDEPRDLFTSLLEEGPHRLAPTGVDLSKHGRPGNVVAGFHNDLSFLSMHGRANEPGLWAWTRSWRKFPATIPDDGCLLMQAGRVLEHLTAGRVLRGYHEVAFYEGVKQEGWRVSLTGFKNARTDTPVRPIGSFTKLPNASKYDMLMDSGARMMETLLRKAV